MLVSRLSDGKMYALKKVKLYMLSSKEKENALNEVRILASVNDPNIVSLKDVSYFWIKYIIIDIDENFVEDLLEI